MKRLTPYIHPNFKELMKEKELLAKVVGQSDGPVHFLIPEIMNENVNKFKEIYSRLGIELLLRYAHKASRSRVFVKQAKDNEIGLDVASSAELMSGILEGIPGSQISCTGPKTDEFISLAIKNGCLISIDSFQELERIDRLYADLKNSVQVEILVRLSNLSPLQRNLRERPSRFGLDLSQVDKVYQFIKGRKYINFRGFHFHHDGYDETAKGEYIWQMLQLIFDAYKQGFKPDIIDMGGAFRSTLLENPLAWNEYVEELCEAVRKGEPFPVWGTTPYGIYLDGLGKLMGREKLLSFSTSEDFVDYVSKTFKVKNQNKQSLGDAIGDALVKIMIEPGFALIYNAGITIFKIIEVKDVGENCFVMVNGNMFSVGSRMFEPVADPILLSLNETSIEEDFAAYVVGNLCREDDFLMKRKINFKSKPKAGDLLIFCNTAAYASDFEETDAIMQPRGKKYVCVKEKSSWSILREEEYAV